MSLQPDLFGGRPVDMRRAMADAAPDPRTRARRENPATSKDAAASLSFATDHHAVIVETMRQHGADGLTVHEVAVYCRLDAHAIGKRMAELEAAGVVEVLCVPGKIGILEMVTRKTPSGRSARVWVLKAAA